MTPARIGRRTYFTLREAAAELDRLGHRTRKGSRIDHSYLSREIQRGRLKGSKTGTSQSAPVLIEAGELERYVSTMKQEEK